ARGIRMVRGGGRGGARTARRAAGLRPLYRRALAVVDCCMQTEEDAARIVALGADPRRVQVAGSLKFDAGGGDAPGDVERLAAAGGALRLIVAGRPRAGEGGRGLDACARVAAGRDDVALLLAPRHPDRLAAVAELVRARGLPLVSYANLGATPGPLPPRAVVLLDVVGPLAHCYALGVLAFVGGSLVPAGGHNVIEPARAGRPILVGQHTENAAEVVERLVAGGAALR